MRNYARCSLAVSALLYLSTFTAAALAQKTEHVIIDTPKPYNNVVTAIQNLGGTVKDQFEYIDAISAEIPSSALPAIRDLVGEDTISKNDIVHAPKPAREDHQHVLKTADSDIYTTIPVGPAMGPIFPVKGPANVPPEKAYAVNGANLKIHDLHADGYTGKGIVIAVVDTGVRPGYASLDADGSVIGGEDLVGDGKNFSDPANDPHGTFVASLISGNAKFPVLAGSLFLSAMNSYFQGTLETSPAGSLVDIIGTAPEAKVYAIRVFGVGASAGAPKSRVIAALERVITLRVAFDNYGQFSASNPKGGFNIKVCNLSFGTSTTYAGHTELEQLLDVMISKDIIPVVAAGDGGTSSLTISSPATSFSALAVGATSPAANDQLLNDVVSLTPGFGAFFRPTSHTQTALFSSRGPTADGRILPDVMAAGAGMLSQGCGGFDSTGTCINDVNNLAMANGTSFSAPVVSGIAAVLRQKFPNASPGQIWNSIVNTAAADQLGDDSTVLDQGQGVVNASAAADYIQKGKASDTIPTPKKKPDSLVSNNIEDNTNLNVVSGAAKQQFKNLKPGERGEILYQIDPDTAQVIINFTNVKFGANQNTVFGDDIFFNVQTAKTSSGGFGDYFPCPPFFVTGDTSIVIPDPTCSFPEFLEPGVMRITLTGDSTNASNVVSADVGVTSSKMPPAGASAKGKIRGGDNLIFTFNVPAGVSQASFELQWDQDWGHYPTSDLDMYVIDPNRVINGAGATLNSPERAFASNPIPGTWQIELVGFSVPTKKDNFTLTVLLDGKLVQKLKQQ